MSQFGERNVMYVTVWREECDVCRILERGM